ncbi:carboxypeptidase-like regulatory domain-containing protein [Mucilaginibacter lacusdianchii]|uniref:carboxypeptidase-like regulatory domain-containing protein n=1 Tax=Mucilaginibacter lacusdianchii TaxID=2684211 RepID=UPI00131D3F83|nr:carboxypeptidase-like regulatory domain-containing protein [Mucilaginibacter sp. JXJ CY 39]
MKLKFTFIGMALAMLLAGCSKDEFNERDAIEAQKELLNMQYQHELDLEALKQKGTTALQELINTATLNQLKLTDSLQRRNAILANQKDYSVTVVDAYTNAPVADADVTVSSLGKIVSAKTNAQGVASFSALNLYPTSAFMVSKTGYAATQILQQNITAGTAKLWNTSDLSNEITGTLYIETDLTNATPEKVGENVLVTASASVSNSSSGSYNVYYPAYTKADGTYSIKIPAAINGYTLSFQQVTSDQKLFVNATADDQSTAFPNSLPRIATVKTYFNVNSFNAGYPNVTNNYYFKVSADKTGKVLYIPGYYYNYNNYNQVMLSNINGKYQIEKLYTYNYSYYNNLYVDINSFTYDPQAQVDVQMVDVAGNLIESAPKLVATAGSNGKLTSYYSPEGGSGYIHLKRDASGNLVAGAKGVILKATPYDSYSNLYYMNFTNNLNTAVNNTVNNTYLSNNKGDKKVVNFYYGSGDSREKQVY